MYIKIFKKDLNFIFNNISACAICGVLCISLPIPIIVNNFNKFYEKAKIEEEILLKKKKASWEDAKRGNACKLVRAFLCVIFKTFSGFPYKKVYISNMTD